MHVWDLPSAYLPARVPWPTFKGNPLRTGVMGRPGSPRGRLGSRGDGRRRRRGVTVSGDGRFPEAGPWRIERSRAGEIRALHCIPSRSLRIRNPRQAVLVPQSGLATT